MTFLRNTWYVAAWDDELKAGAMLQRTLLDESVLLLRDAAGQVHALQDRCPHRFAPLHMGTFADNAVQCRYHGLKFGLDGRCVHNPHGPIPKAASVKTYPVVERHSLIWIWMGEAGKADPATIADFSYQDPDTAFVGKDYLLVKSNYLLEIDNILDLSHVEFLHPGTLGSSGISKGRFEADQVGNTVWSKRLTDGEVLTDTLSDAMGVPRGAPVDRWINVRWDAPANMALYTGAVCSGQPHSQGRETPTTHCFTPETANTSHYWFSIAFPRDMGEFGAKMAQENVQYLRVPFEQEDLPMLQAQQLNMGEADFLSLKPILLSGDAAAVRARHTLNKLIEAERVS